MSTMRGTKVKIFLYVCAIIVITGLIVCFKNALSQVDEVKKIYDTCRLQQENLSTQLEGMSIYKKQLQISLKKEKADHQQMKIDKDLKFNEEKMKSEKIINEAKNKFNSLQQHFNLLQTQYDDFKEESSRIQKKQLNEINDLQSKLTEVQEQLKKIEAVKESLKSQYLELQVIKEDLEKQVQSSRLNKSETNTQMLHLTKENSQLRREIEKLKVKCSTLDTLQEPQRNIETSSATNLQPQIDEMRLGILSPPNAIEKASSAKSSTASAVSKGKLNGARPLLLPTVTPQSVLKKNILKVPEGVVPMPEKPSEEQKVDAEIMNNRYKSQIHDAEMKEDKDTGANEEFDAPGHGPNAAGYDNIGFAGKPEGVKDEKKHIDTLGVDQKKSFDQNEDMGNDNNDIQVEDPAEDDDPDYGARNFQDLAVRN